MARNFMALTINAQLPHGQSCYYAGDIVAGVLHADVRKNFTVGSLSVA